LNSNKSQGKKVDTFFTIEAVFKGLENSEKERKKLLRLEKEKRAGKFNKLVKRKGDN
jgi:hypothetical protein